MSAPCHLLREKAFSASRASGYGVTFPELTQPGGANDKQGPLIADWNCGELGSIPLPGPSCPTWPSGSGKVGTPCVCMHLAKARLKVPELELPWLPLLLLDETFPELLEVLGLPLGEAAGVAAPALQPASRTRLAPVMAARTPRLRGPPSPRRATRIMGGTFMFVTILVSSRGAAFLRRVEAAKKCLGVSDSETAVTRRSWRL
jgi:hypothetical protein